MPRSQVTEERRLEPMDIRRITPTGVRRTPFAVALAPRSDHATRAAFPAHRLSQTNQHMLNSHPKAVGRLRTMKVGALNCITGSVTNITKGEVMSGQGRSPRTFARGFCHDPRIFKELGIKKETPSR